MNERRRSPRRTVKARIRITNSYLGMIDAYSRDISNTGLFLLLNPIPPIARGSYLGLHLLDSTNPLILFNARVVRMSHEGVAVALVDYEIGGRRYTMDELYRQWSMSRTDIQQSKDRS